MSHEMEEWLTDDTKGITCKKLFDAKTNKIDYGGFPVRDKNQLTHQVTRHNLSKLKCYKNKGKS